MSWSFSVTASRNDAPLKFKAAKLAQHAYNEHSGALLDLIQDFAVSAAKLAANELSEATLGSYGHVNVDGTGQFTVTLSITNPTQTIREVEAPLELFETSYAEPKPRPKKASK